MLARFVAWTGFCRTRSISKQILGCLMLNIPKFLRRPMSKILRIPRRPRVAGPRTVVGQPFDRSRRIKARANGLARCKAAERGLVAIVPFADDTGVVTAPLKGFAQQRVVAAIVAAAGPDVTARVHHRAAGNTDCARP